MKRTWLKRDWNWASQKQASNNAFGAAPAVSTVTVTDANGNSVTAKLTTGSSTANIISQVASVGGFPGAPTGVHAAAVLGSKTSAIVSFNAPASKGGLPIFSYQVSANPSRPSAGAPTANGTGRHIKVNGLTAVGRHAEDRKSTTLPIGDAAVCRESARSAEVGTCENGGHL